MDTFNKDTFNKDLLTNFHECHKYEISSKIDDFNIINQIFLKNGMSVNFEQKYKNYKYLIVLLKKDVNNFIDSLPKDIIVKLKNVNADDYDNYDNYDNYDPKTIKEYEFILMIECPGEFTNTTPNNNAYMDIIRIVQYDKYIYYRISTKEPLDTYGFQMKRSKLYNVKTEAFETDVFYICEYVQYLYNEDDENKNKYADYKNYANCARKLSIFVMLNLEIHVGYSYGSCGSRSSRGLTLRLICDLKNMQMVQKYVDDKKLEEKYGYKIEVQEQMIVKNGYITFESDQNKSQNQNQSQQGFFTKMYSYVKKKITGSN